MCAPGSAKAASVAARRDPRKGPGCACMALAGAPTVLCVQARCVLVPALVCHDFCHEQTLRDARLCTGI